MEDPFRDFYFSGKTEVKRASFSNEWVRSRILVPGLFEGLRLELRVIIYLLIETGARLSELVNLRPEDIRLNAKVPHIAIRPEQNREYSPAPVPIAAGPLVASACAHQRADLAPHRPSDPAVSYRLSTAAPGPLLCPSGFAESHRFGCRRPAGWIR